jgi:Zn-dependent peptidase ImmA (M78 family)
MIYPWLSPEEISSAARLFLIRAIGQDGTNQRRVDLNKVLFDCLCEKEGMCFDDESDLGYQNGDKILGQTLPSDGKIQIDVSLKGNGEEGRYRFTVGHEVGHWVLHRPIHLAHAANLDLFRQFGDSPAITSLSRTIFPQSQRSSVVREEWQANRFAVALLIDPELLRTEFLERFGNPPLIESNSQAAATESLRIRSRRAANSRLRDLPPLCEVFGLSVEAMAIALEARGYIVEGIPII